MSADLMLRVVAPENLQAVQNYLSYTEPSPQLLMDAHPDWNPGQLWVALAAESHALLSAFHRACEDTDELWVGQVSWIKAELTGSIERYVPGAVRGMQELWSVPRQVTPLLVKCSMDAMNRPNRSIYGRRELLVTRQVVQANWPYLATGRRLRFPGGQRMISYRSPGVQRARAVKRFLQNHLGELAMVSSD